MCKFNRKHIQWGIVLLILILILWGVFDETIIDLTQKTPTTPVTVFIIDQYGAQIYNVSVNLNNGTTGDHTLYLGMGDRTDKEGKAYFNLPDGEYRFLAFFQGDRFETAPENNCIVPGCTERTIIIPIKQFPVTVFDNEDIPQSGFEVRIINVESYDVYTEISDESGNALFNLPQGYYQYIVNGFGTYYKSLIFDRPNTLAAYVHLPNKVEVIILNDIEKPVSGVNVYACRNDVCFEPVEKTNSDGIAVFALSKNVYHFYAEKKGIKYWSGVDNHCEVPDCDTVVINVK